MNGESELGSVSPTATVTSKLVLGLPGSPDSPLKFWHAFTSWKDNIGLVWGQFPIPDLDAALMSCHSCWGGPFRDAAASATQAPAKSSRRLTASPNWTGGNRALRTDVCSCVPGEESHNSCGREGTTAGES